MDKNTLINTLDYWSYWDKDLPQIINRSVNLPKKLENKIALNIQGVRRSGKSTLLGQIITHYKLDPARCALVNFEDPKLLNESNFNILEEIIQVFSEMHPKGKLYFFFDEIQNINGWEKWLRTKLDRPDRYYFIVTGSNASLLSGEFSTVLTGRHLTIELFPLSFSELKGVRKSLSLTDYLNQGGFPEPFNSDNGDLLLKQYFDDIIEKDIRERLGSRSSTSIRQVVQMVYESAGSELSLRKIAGVTGISVDTVSSYLEACEAAYLLFSCPFFAYSEKKRASKNKKYYPIDSGLRRTVITKTGLDLGKMLEIAVFLELRKSYAEVYYWKNKGEVDFVINTSSQLIPIQVTWEDPLERHLKSLEEFYESYPQADNVKIINKENFLDEANSL